MMSLEQASHAMALAAQHHRFRHAHPNARLFVMANTRGEERLLGALGADVCSAPQNMSAGEGMYHPIAGRRRKFDAIYDAQIAPFERPKISRLFPSCTSVTQIFAGWLPRLKNAEFRKFVNKLRRDHVIANDVVADTVVPAT